MRLIGIVTHPFDATPAKDPARNIELSDTGPTVAPTTKARPTGSIVKWTLKGLNLVDYDETAFVTGHDIITEYDYCKSVGYQLGLRGLDVCTGCGPDAMKGPMKGAAVGHAKQRINNGRYIGMTEPGIIAAESPNPIVNELVILPDIEKRLEAFVRCGHGFVLFPSGVGTAEEIFHLLGILLHPDNTDLPFPPIFTGPESSEEFFRDIDDFLRATLDVEATSKYQIVIDDPIKVANLINDGIRTVSHYRRSYADAFYFNWRLDIDLQFQLPV